MNEFEYYRRHADAKIQIVVHVAGEPEGGRQRCARCGEVLISTDGFTALLGQQPCWWEPSANVECSARGQVLSLAAPTCPAARGAA